jgi:hypothetical protein
MRWSLKSVLLYVTVFCLCLSFTWLPIRAGALGIIAIAALLAFVLRWSAWWRIVTVALIGAALCYTCLIIDCIDKFASTRFESIDAPAYMDLRLPYVIPMGAFVGGSLGLLLYIRKQKSSEASH